MGGRLCIQVELDRAKQNLDFATKAADGKRNVAARTANAASPKTKFSKSVHREAILSAIALDWVQIAVEGGLWVRPGKPRSEQIGAGLPQKAAGLLRCRSRPSRATSGCPT